MTLDELLDILIKMRMEGYGRCQVMTADDEIVSDAEIGYPLPESDDDTHVIYINTRSFDEEPDDNRYTDPTDPPAIQEWMKS
jgi:hypothetical protein